MTPIDKPSTPDDTPGRHTRLAPGVHVHQDALRFAANRASGPGGQNVNKRSTKVELRVHLHDIPIPDPAKTRLRKLASHHLTSHDELIISAQTGRTQPDNRRRALDHLAQLVLRALAPPKQRRPTTPTKGSKQRRLDAKRQRGQLKQQRAARRPDKD